VTELLWAIPAVQSVDDIDPSEAGDSIVTVQIGAKSDIRDVVCRSLVSADVSVLQLTRRQGLENMVLKLLGGDEANARRRARKRRDVAEADEAAAEERQEPSQAEEVEGGA
jgi:hypothetical protein